MAIAFSAAIGGLPETAVEVLGEIDGRTSPPRGTLRAAGFELPATAGPTNARVCVSRERRIVSAERRLRRWPRNCTERGMSRGVSYGRRKSTGMRG